MSAFLGIECSSPDCIAAAVCQTSMGPCCNKHYLRVRAHGAFDLPTRARSRDCRCSRCGAAFDRGYPIAASRARKNQFCSAECKANYRAEQAALNLADRFWSHVDKRGPEECWEWKSQRAPSGYGAFNAGAGQTTIASRFAFVLTKGDPGELFVCHSCDNPPCCNPAHLWAGTATENMRDAANKGRIAKTSRPGSSHPQAKVSEADVLVIRSSARPRKELAEQYGVTSTQIYHIQTGKQWRHL